MLVILLRLLAKEILGEYVMAFIAGAWGLTLNETLFILAVILIVADFFWQTDIPTHIAYIILSVLIAINIPFHFMYKILIGLLAWFAIVGFHYLFWRQFIQTIINKFIAPDKYKDGADGLVDMIGEIREIEQQKMVMVKGDLWPIDPTENVRAGEKVKVVKVKNGILTVKTIEGS